MPLSSFPIYTSGATSFESSAYFPIFVQQSQSQEYIPICVGCGAIEKSSWFPITVLGGSPSTGFPAYIPLFVKVDDTVEETDSLTLFVQVDPSVTDYIPLFLLGVEESSDYIPVYITGIGYKEINDGAFDNSGYFVSAEMVPIYINRASYSEYLDIFVMNTATEASDDIPITIFGVTGVPTSNFPIYTSGFDEESEMLRLYIRGGV